MVKRIPKAKKQMRKYRKRIYRRRRGRNFVKTTHLPLGQVQLVKHKYLETLQLNTSLGIKAIYTFQINSLNKPNYTGSGHQPIGFDQMSAFFGRYTVVGARLRMKFWSRDADETLAIGLYFSEEASITSYSPAQLIEQGALTYRLVPVTGSDASNQQIHYLSAKLSVKKFCKVANIRDYQTLGANTNESPARAVYAHVVMWQPDGGSSSASGSVYLEMDQVALWTKPQTISQS